MRFLRDLGRLWLILLVGILLNGRFGVIGWLATRVGRALCWQPLGKRVSIQMAELDPIQAPTPLLWTGTVTALVTLTNPHTQRERSYPLVVLDPPVSWRSHPVERVLLSPRHRGYDIEALPLTGIGVNIYDTGPNPAQTVPESLMTTGWLRLRRFERAPAE